MTLDGIIIFACISMACLISYCLGYLQAEKRLRPILPSDRMQSVWGDVAEVPASFHSTGVTGKAQSDHV